MKGNPTSQEPGKGASSEPGAGQTEQAAKSGKKSSPWAQVARYSAIGMTIPSHLFAGWLLGTILDKVFHTTFLDIVLVLVGAVSGFVEMIRLASKNPD